MNRRFAQLLAQSGMVLAIGMWLSSCVASGTSRVEEHVSDPFLSRGQELFLGDDFEGAAASFSEVVATATSAELRAEALYWRGLSHYGTANYFQARQDLEWCLREARGASLRGAAEAALGRVLMETGNTRTAREHYQKALDQGGERIDRAELTYLLGLSYQREGNWEEAAFHFRRVTDYYGLSPYGEYAQEKLAHVGEKFFVQIGAFSEEAKADNLRRDAAGRGLSATVRHLTRNNRDLYCVWVGPFDTWAEAVEKAESLRAFSYQTFVVP